MFKYQNVKGRCKCLDQTNFTDEEDDESAFIKLWHINLQRLIEIIGQTKGYSIFFINLSLFIFKYFLLMMFEELWVFTNVLFDPHLWWFLQNQNYIRDTKYIQKCISWVNTIV